MKDVVDHWLNEMCELQYSRTLKFIVLDVVQSFVCTEFLPQAVMVNMKDWVETVTDTAPVEVSSVIPEVLPSLIVSE